MQNKSDNRSEPRIICFDLETLPNLTEVMKVFAGITDWPGKGMRADINSIICAGWKVFGEDKTHCINAWDFKGWKKNVNDDYEVVKGIYNVLKGADAVVTHNGKRFDWKFLTTRLMHHKLPTLPNIKHIDTCALSKRNLFLTANRLDKVGQFLTGDRKLENGGWDLWVKVLQRDPKAMKLMTDYCKQDVLLLEKVFKALRPFAKDIPNYNIFGRHEKPLCPTCGGTRLQKHGFQVTKTMMYQRYQCQDCASVCRTNVQNNLPR
jgi:DNA polymerase elongation subunit (family B)